MYYKSLKSVHQVASKNMKNTECSGTLISLASFDEFIVLPCNRQMIKSNTSVLIKLGFS